MSKQSTIHFFPERIAWMGAGVLSLGFFLLLPLLLSMSLSDSPSAVRRERKVKSEELVPYSFHLPLSDRIPGLSVPNLQGEMTFSFDPPRPDGTMDGNRLLVRMSKSGESKRVLLPCRLDLEFQGDRLKFAGMPTLFWIDLSLIDGFIQGKTTITSMDGSQMDGGSFSVQGQESPVRGAAEFPDGSPFRLLAEAKWWGKDLFKTGGEASERLEIGSHGIVELGASDWLVWKEGKWEKQGAPDKDLPIAHVQVCSSKCLILEGWGADGHVRISLNSAVGPLFKMKGEELFSSIRVRSEKQISCMLEKQCMVLKTGDWVLKTGGRWKILRKKDERDAFLNGKLFGELFILEQISQKQGQKMIQGRLFNPGRTQVVSIEMPAQAGRKVGDKGLRKGRAL